MTRHPLTRSHGRFQPFALYTGLLAALAVSPLFATSSRLHGPFGVVHAESRATQDPPAAGDAAAVEQALPAAPHYDPSGLRPQLMEPRVALALAAYLTSCGDADSALAHLRALDGTITNPAQAQRVAEEVARLQEWIEKRDSFLAHVHASGGKLEVADGDKRRRVEIDRIEKGSVHFVDNRWDIASIRVIDLDPLELAEEMGNKKSGIDPGNTRIFMNTLCGHKRWKGIVKGDDEAAERLRFAGEHEYPVWLGSGRCYAGLLDLSTRGAPQDPAAGSATLASVRSLIAEFAGRMELEESREGLAKLAECAQFQALASGDLASLFAGEVTQLDEGRVRVVYNFSDPAQLRDFDRGRYARDGSGFAADAESKGMDIKDGALFAEGTACLRTHANFEGPIDVRYTYASIDKQGIGRLTLGVHDDGEGDLLHAQGAMLLWWSDKSQSPPMGSEHFDGMISYRPRAEYEIRLKLDAEGNVDLSRSGEPCIAMTNCPRKRGAVFLALDDVSGGGKLRVSELVIEGMLTPDAQHTLRLRSAARVADELR